MAARRYPFTPHLRFGAGVRCPSAALKTGLMQDLLTGKVSVEPLLVGAGR